MPAQNTLLRSLPESVLSLLKPRLRHQQFGEGYTLFRAGDKVSSVYFFVSGAVSLVTELATGQTVESGMIGRDSVVAGGAALDDRDSVYKAIVQVPGSAYVLDVEHARHVARESLEFRTAIIRHEQLILAQAQQSAACNATHNLNQRLARWMLRTRDVTGSDNFLLTQQFIADMLGVGRTSVSITAHALQQAGLITYRRGHIHIEKVETLEGLSCECYETIRQRYQKLLLASTSDRTPA